MSMRKMMLSVCIGLTTALALSAQTTFDPQQHKVVTTQRADGRYMSTYGVAHALLKHTTPKYAYRTDFSKEEFAAWQEGVREAMVEIMCHPVIEGQPAPVCIGREQRDGYRWEKWEFYPLPECVSTFIVLIPDSVKTPAPAVLCIPGSGMAKEHLTGDIAVRNPHTAMALNIVKRGYIAVAVDNAAAGEAADLEPLAGSGYDYDTTSRILLELGWSWLGYTSYLDRHVLEWMKTQPLIRKDRIVLSGFSLGTEPLMVLGVLDPTVYAFVYNDFLCQTQERAIVMTAPDERGRRGFPNSIRHLIPRFWEFFNFPDIVASLAPRPIIFTEGGLDRDFDLVRHAYAASGHPEAVETHHYAKYAAPETRNPATALPEGLDRTTFYNSVNVDSPNHYFKDEYVLPWLDRILAEP